MRDKNLFIPFYSSLIPHPSSLHLSLRGDLFAALLCFFDCADHEEGLFWQIVVLAVNYLAEAAYRVGQLDVLAFQSCELRGDEHGLREEPLNLARARDRQLVFV